MAKKTKIDFGELNTIPDIDVTEQITSINNKETVETKENKNNFLSSVTKIESGQKKSTKKKYEYKKIFDGSMEAHKSSKKTANIYNYNMERISILCSLNKGLSIADAINYIINDFFVINNDEIKEEYKKFYLKFNEKL